MRKKRGHPEQGDKLNQDLCPEEFEICVPKACKLLGEWDEEPAWEEYLKTLIPDGMPPEHYEPIPCFSCDCKPGRRLRGELAIAHACKVLDKIRRQALSLEQVSAVDVGFLIWERKGEFGNILALRIHVNKKRPPEQLAQMGLESLTRAAYALADFALPESVPMDWKWPSGQPGGSPGRDRYWTIARRRANFPDPKSKCLKSERWIHLMELLEREFAEDKELWKGIGRYPIGGVSEDDLSIFCPRPIAETRTLADIRLCICGVPIDVVNAEYNPTVTHPGGDADKGVFVRRPRRSNRLGNEEQLLIGRGRVNPLVGGVSVGSVTRQAGTLATIVWDRTDGTPCVLGNWHVLAGATPRVDQPVYQPAIFDGGTDDDVVAYLKRWHLGEEGDAAIAELTGNRSYASGEILGLWHSISGYLPPRLNMEVRKFGRTTGFTQGFIDGIHLATNIDYGNGVVRFFRDQFHIAPLCAGEDVSQVGDSGSLVVTSLKPVELQEDLSKLYGWLRDCSGQERRALCDDMRKTLKKPDITCAEVAELLEEVEIEGGKAKECRRFCGIAIEYFEQWRARCRRISEGEARCEVICEALKECDVFACKDPSEVIDCIEEYLKKPKPEEEENGNSRAAAAEQQTGAIDPEKLLLALKHLLDDRPDELFDALSDSVKKFRHRRKDERDRDATRAYYAVGMIFAGDTPGSPFGEFAVASELSKLEEKLRFSLRPVFEPRSGFRELRERPPRRGRGGRAGRSGSGLSPGEQSADPRGGGPQPDLEPAQSSAGSGPGSGSGGG
jgi:hypothetical protein